MHDIVHGQLYHRWRVWEQVWMREELQSMKKAILVRILMTSCSDVVDERGRSADTARTGCVCTGDLKRLVVQ